MRGSWRGVFTILLSVSWASKENEIQENIPLETLNCHNDFKTRIICRWEEMANAQRYLNLTLYHKKYDPSVGSDSVSCEPGHNISLPTCRFPPCVPKACYIRQVGFVSSHIDLYGFRINRPLQLELSVNLTQNIQPPPPENLKIMKNGTEGFLLSWEMPQSWNQSFLSSMGGLKFSVTYKRPWEPWEEASTISSSSSHVLLGHDRLIPDNLYVARVQAMTLRGHPSWWSSEVSWKSQEGDAAQPKNLRCFFDGHRQLNCTWEVRTEISHSVSFGLFYKNGSDEVECKPLLLERKPESPYIQYSCQIHVEDPINQSQYRVTVKTKKKEKSLPSRINIQLQPPDISVKEHEGIYRLKWNITKTAYDFMTYKYEIQYKKLSEPWEANMTQTQKNRQEFEIFKASLNEATEYSARVRTKVTDSYDGPWSEWSKECNWKTGKEFPLMVVGVVMVIITILGLLGSWYCYNFGTRLKTNWENNIPNPSKSLMFQFTDKKSLKFSSNPWEKEKEYFVFSVNGLNFEDKALVSPLTALDPQDMSSLSSDCDSYPVSITLPDEDPSLSSSQKVTQIKEPASGFAFNGPYLHFPQRHSLPNLSDQMGSYEAEGSKKQPSGSLEYLLLPKGGKGNLVPMAKVAKPGGDREEKENSCAQPTSREKGESCLLKERAALPSEEPGQEKNLSPIVASSKGALKLAGGSGYIAPEDLELGSEKPESPPLLTVPPILCSTPESSLDLSPGETKRSPSAPTPEMLALGGYVEAPPNMTSDEPPPEKSSPLQVESSAPNLMDAQQDENITVFHPEGLVLQQIGDYCFIPSQGQLISPSQCPEKMAKPQNIPGKEPPDQTLPQVPAIQLFKAMKHQEYLILPTCPGQVC